jgi:spermidine synthase
MDTKPPKATINGGQLIARKRTAFQLIDLERNHDGSHSLYLDGNIQFVEGQDDREYHGVLASFPAKRFHGVPFKALIMGGGDGLAARNLVRLPNCTAVRMVEIDGGMVDFCAQHPVLRRLNRDAFRDPKLQVHVGDARGFVVAQPTERYDLAIVDFPDPEPDIVDLFQAPFYSALLRHMNPRRAVISVQASSARSPVETYVLSSLSQAMGCPAQSFYFKGRLMDDGAIVIGDTGADRSRNKTA